MSKIDPTGAYKSPGKKHSFKFILEGDIRFGPSYYKVELDGKLIANRRFGFEFMWHPGNKYLALQEWLTTDERNGPFTTLTLVDLEKRNLARISEAEQGFIVPLGFRNNLIIFNKEYYGTGKKVEFEINLDNVTNWEPE